MRQTHDRTADHPQPLMQGGEEAERARTGVPQATEDVAHPFDVDGVPRALWWDEAAHVLRLLDQTLLPERCEVLACADSGTVAAAIRALRVRGAPAIGVAAAYGLALGAYQALAGAAGGDLRPEDALARLRVIAGELRATRPTAVNLAWALDRSLAVAAAHLACDGAPRTLPDTLLTHCNAGALATAGIGTALAPIFVAHAAGKRLHVFVDETRPLLQGARLTAWELQRAGVPLTLIGDSMAAHFMRRAGIRAVFVGADRIAANGDVANKIGTYGLAVLAREHGIPLYVVAPRSTVDLAMPDGDAIPIEERAPEELTHVRGAAIAPVGVGVANPAFDMTPARYVTAIITEAGIAREPYAASLRKLFAAQTTQTVS
ncbi:MAG: S-methyl-5-thioribose-1-phosphate isomerase [Ktedonobacterales bacterium]